ncbi:hypothetical protein L484_012777 [Morus notabilis]|uniref:Uncharacterized protein n=1 Tax=Morus notabilis TaxID=981085 RepID=W9SK77_9ROSA|nr:hypothetical protein L484_012777 [Morus notabilis]
MRKIFYSPMLVHDHVDQALHFLAGIRIPSVLRRWRIRSMSFSGCSAEGLEASAVPRAVSSTHD